MLSFLLSLYKYPANTCSGIVSFVKLSSTPLPEKGRFISRGAEGFGAKATAEVSVDVHHGSGIIQIKDINVIKVIKKGAQSLLLGSNSLAFVTTKDKSEN